MGSTSGVMTNPGSMKGNQVAYLVCTEGDAFSEVIERLGGYVWGCSPMHMTGSHMVILPDTVELECGEMKVQGKCCRFTYVHRL